MVYVKFIQKYFYSLISIQKHIFFIDIKHIF